MTSVPSGCAAAAGPGATAARLPTLAPARRALLAGAAWALTLLAQPGLLTADGVGVLGFAALAPWAVAAAAPGPRADRTLWLVTALGLIGWFGWMRYLLP